MPGDASNSSPWMTAKPNMPLTMMWEEVDRPIKEAPSMSLAKVRCIDANTLVIIWKGFDERSKGNHNGLAGAYFISGVAGIGIATAMLLVGMGFALGPIGWIVVAIAFVIWLPANLFIETHKDNKLQEWPSRCHFGSGTDKYPDTATHVEQYKLALAE